MYSLGTKVKPQWEAHLPLIIKHICNEGIKTEPQFSAAVEYLLSHAVSGVNEEEFKRACGVGVVVSQDEIEDTVRTIFVNKRKLFALGQISH